MKYIFKIFIIVGLILVIENFSTGQSNDNCSDPMKQAAIWEKIAPYFSPPAKYKGQYGDYRSPLKFYNGDTVKTPVEWGERRKEILTLWNKMMGE